MTDYKKMIAEHSCKPNQGCGVMTICMCGVAEDMADEIERLRDENEKLRAIIDQLRGVFFNGVYIAESKVAKLNLARAALGEKE